MRGLVVAVLVIARLAGTADASFINYTAREINCKIVYWSAVPKAADASVRYVYGKLDPKSKGKLVALATETERTLFFDFVPPNLGEIRGFKIRLHLYTTPMAADYAKSRSLILKGADGIVFIADADPMRAKANAASLAELKHTLASHGYAYDKVPIVFQLQNTGAKNALSVEALTQALGDRPAYEANPATGVGLFDTVKAVTKLLLLALRTAEPPPQP